MSDEVLLSRLAGVRRVGFIGLARKSGKTTALNHVSGLLGARGERLGLLACGRDGETTDLLYGNPKPPVDVTAGQLLLTTDIEADRATAQLTQIHDPGLHTALGPLRIFEVDRPGRVVLVGPVTVDELTAAAERMQASGCDRILVDGAVNRRAFARPGVVEGAVVSTGAALAGDLDRLVSKTVDAVAPLLLPRFTEGDDTHTYEIFFPFTDEVAETLIDGDFEGVVLVTDPAAVFLEPRTLARLSSAGIRIAVRDRVPILAITVNPYAPNGPGGDAEALLARLGEAFPGIPVLDVMAGTPCASPG